MDVGGILVGASVTTLIGYVGYSYRNTVACSLTCTSIKLSIVDNNLIFVGNAPSQSPLTVQRLDIKNYGFRKLQDVELHVPVRLPVLFYEVNSATSISKNAIKIEVDDELLKISIPTMPKGEEIRVNFANTASYEGEYRDIRGTGGSYRVVEGKRHKVRRDALFAFLPFMLIALLMWMLPALAGYLTQPAKSSSLAIGASHPKLP